jgi:flavorubredoxin
MNAAPTGKLPRVLDGNLLWTGRCLLSDYQGEQVHGHFATYLIRGEAKTMLIDTGHPAHWPAVERDITNFLGERTLDYIFLTHGEFAHAGSLPQIMKKYPNAIALGNVPEYPLYYPELAERMRIVKPGDSVDLGDRRIHFVPCIWKDLPTLWAFDDVGRTLFASDAFAYLHYHSAGKCDFTGSEQPAPDLKLIQFFNERALRWTRYTDVRTTFAAIDELLLRLKPRMIAPAHGSIIDDPSAMLPLMKEGMLTGVYQAIAGDGSTTPKTTTRHSLI